MIRISRRQLTPFGHGRSAVLLEYFAWGEMTFEIKMIVDRGMNGREFLQGLRWSQKIGQLIKVYSAI
jgi:hypothetical protein